METRSEKMSWRNFNNSWWMKMQISVFRSLVFLMVGVTLFSSNSPRVPRPSLWCPSSQDWPLPLDDAWVMPAPSLPEERAGPTRRSIHWRQREWRCPCLQHNLESPCYTWAWGVNFVYHIVCPWGPLAGSWARRGGGAQTRGWGGGGGWQVAMRATLPNFYSNPEVTGVSYEVSCASGEFYFSVAANRYMISCMHIDLMLLLFRSKGLMHVASSPYWKWEWKVTVKMAWASVSLFKGDNWRVSGLFKQSQALF